MSKLLTTFQERFGEWLNSPWTTLAIVSLDLVGRYFSDHPTCGLSK